MRDRDFTYAERGLTQTGQWPAGYRQAAFREEVGHGQEAYLRLARGILHWEIQRRSGLRVQADAAEAAVGDRVVSGFGVGPFRLNAPCRVVWVEPATAGDDGPARSGFGYGTLPGHPVRGEEAFLAVLAEDGSVHFELLAYSRPSNWFYTVGGFAARAAQRQATRGYLRAARSIAAGE